MDLTPFQMKPPAIFVTIFAKDYAHLLLQVLVVLWVMQVATPTALVATTIPSVTLPLQTIHNVP